MAELVTIAGLGLIWYLFVHKETEKYEVPSSVPPIQITSELTQSLIQLAQPALAKKIGKCVYPIETGYIRQDGDVFHCQFMFTVMDPYPYGIGVTADIKKNEVVSLEIQNMNTIDKIDAFDQFMTGDQLKDSVLPTKVQLQNAIG